MSFPSVFFRVFFVALFVSQNLLAADYHSPRVAALGGAGRAGPLITDGIYLNPAAIPFLNAYVINASHNSYSGPNDGEPKGRVTQASIQDGSDGLFQAGVGYTRKSFGRTVNVGSALKVAPMVGAGLSAKFAFGSESRESTQEVGISALGGVMDWLQVGFVADNLLQGEKTKNWGYYRELGLGARANIMKLLYVYFDPQMTPDKPGDAFGYSFGAEIPLMADLFLRGGVNRNIFQPHLNQYGHGTGFGLGWNFPRLSLDFAMARTIEPVRTDQLIFSVTIL